MIATAALAVAVHLVMVQAEDRVHLVVLRDAAAAACPSDEELAQRVRARIGSEPFRDDRAGRELRVGIARSGDALEAKIALFGPDGARLGRRVLSGDAGCDGLADDLVLAVAIAIDPLLLVRRKPITAATPAAAAATGAPAGSAPVEIHDDDVSIAARPLRPDLPERVVADRGFDIPGPASLGARAVLSVVAGVGVIAAPSVRAEASLDYGVLNLDVGARLDLPARYPISDLALIDITLLAAEASPCLAWSYDIVRLRGCGVLEAGVLAGQGVGLEGAKAVASPWIALGGRGGLDLRLWPTLGLLLTGDVAAPLIRPRFVDDRSGRVYAQPAAVVGSLGLGLELQIF